MRSSIYSGQVSHSRRTPLPHAFRYRVYMMYLDLGELSQVFAGRWLWSTNRPALARFRRANYLGNPNEPLDTSVRDTVQQRTGTRPAGPIRLLTNLSYFGYCFNPISIYYCFDRDDTRLETVLAEVSNTPWGERHCYVLTDDMNRGDERTRRFMTRKELHVSPFMDMDMQYDWQLTEPSEHLVVRINNTVNREPCFTATLALQRTGISGRSLAAVLLGYPLMTLKVVFAIHWQALRLWLKGCPVRTHPDKRSSLEAHQ